MLVKNAEMRQSSSSLVIGTQLERDNVSVDMDDEDDDSDLEIVIEGKAVHDNPDKPRRTTVQLTEIVDHRYNHDCEDHFIAGKDSKTYYASLRNERAKQIEIEKENARASKDKEKKKPSIYEQLKAKKREEVVEQQKKRHQETKQFLSKSSSSSSTHGEMLGSVRVPPPSDVFRVNALARAKQMEEQRQQQAIEAQANKHLIQRPLANSSSGGNSILNMTKSGGGNDSNGNHINRTGVSKPGKSHLLGVRGRQTQGSGLTNRKDFVAVGKTVLLTGDDIKLLEATRKKQRTQAQQPKQTVEQKEAAKKALNDEINVLLGKASSHAEEVEVEWMQNFEKKLSKQEYREKKMEDENKVQVFKVKGFHCLTCQIITEQPVASCRERRHMINEVSTTKRLFECTRCRKKTPLLGNGFQPHYPCVCGNHQWVQCGKHGTGDERAGMALGERGIFGERLVTSASEWSSRVDVDSIKMQRNNL